MKDDQQLDRWPSYLPGPKDDLLALGVVSLNYGYLENVLRVLFGMVTGMHQAQMAAIFDRLNNDARQAVLDQMLGAHPFIPEIKTLVRHFLDAFAICAGNRHAIMHSHHGGIHSGSRGTGGIVLRRYSRAGSASVFFAHAESLRAIADDIDQQSQFGIQVVLTVQSFLLCQKEDRLADFGRHPLPETPPLPKTLGWLPAQGLQTDQFRP